MDYKDSAVVVSGFGDDCPARGLLRVGDWIVAVDGDPCAELSWPEIVARFREKASSGGVLELGVIDGPTS